MVNFRFLFLYIAGFFCTKNCFCNLKISYTERSLIDIYRLCFYNLYLFFQQPKENLYITCSNFVF